MSTVGGNNAYPTIETVLNLVRSLVLDDMPGATGIVGQGQVYVDDMNVSVTLSNFFNAALRELCRDLRTSQGPMLIRDNVIVTGLTPINGPNGLAAPDPARQVQLGFTGYFDGLQMNPNIKLPIDCLMVDVVWERLTNSNGEFQLLTETPLALSGVWQGERFGVWEWRQDMVNLRGATTTRDLRLRYQGRLVNLYEPGVNLATTYIPILDCEEVLANKIVVSIARRIAPERVVDAKQEARESLFKFLSEQVKRKQGDNYATQGYGSEMGPVLC